MSSLSSYDIAAIVFAVVSLAPAYLLFKFLKSTAVVKQKHYQAGGAIGGYVIVLGMLLGAKVAAEARGRQAAERQRDESDRRYADLKTRFDDATRKAEIVGIIQPVRKHMRVALAIDDKPADSTTGRFRLAALDNQLQEANAVLYVETDAGTYPFIPPPGADLTNLTIELGRNP